MKFEDLEVWKRSARLSTEAYKTLNTLKDYGFKDQITRSGLSIPSNIAEGMERNSNKEKARFLDIAKGSAAELPTQTYIGIEIGYIPKKIGNHWISETKEISAMLVSLIKAINNHTANCQLPTANCQLPTANCQLPTANCQLPTANCQLPTANCQLPTANCQLPTANCQLPTANCQLPTDN